MKNFWGHSRTNITYKKVKLIFIQKNERKFVRGWKIELIFKEICGWNEEKNSQITRTHFVEFYVARLNLKE